MAAEGSDGSAEEDIFLDGGAAGVALRSRSVRRPRGDLLETSISLEALESSDLNDLNESPLEPAADEIDLDAAKKPNSPRSGSGDVQSDESGREHLVDTSAETLRVDSESVERVRLSDEPASTLQQAEGMPGSDSSLSTATDLLAPAGIDHSESGVRSNETEPTPAKNGSDVSVDASDDCSEETSPPVDPSPNEEDQTEACDECDVLQVRIKDMEDQVRALRSALAAREATSSRLKGKSKDAKAAAAAQAEANNDGAVPVGSDEITVLRQEIETMRVTCDFLFRQIQQKEK